MPPGSATSTWAARGTGASPAAGPSVGEQHLHLNDGDSSLRNQLSSWGRGSPIPSPVGWGRAGGPVKWLQLPTHPHSSHSWLGMRKCKTVIGPAVSLSLPHPTPWLHSCRLAPSLAVYSSLLYPDGRGGQLRSEVRVRRAQVSLHHQVPHKASSTCHQL